MNENLREQLFEKISVKRARSSFHAPASGVEESAFSIKKKVD